MEVTLEQKENKSSILTIKIAESNYKSDIDAEIRKVAAQTNMKGFRPGKTPLHLVRNRIIGDVKREKVLDMLQNKLNDYIKENDLDMIGQPLLNSKIDIIDWKKDKNFEFEFELGLIPEFELSMPENSNELLRYNVEMKEERVDEIIQKMLEQHSEMQTGEQIQKGDFFKSEITPVEHSEEKKDANDTLFSADNYIPTNQLTEEAFALFEGKALEDVVIIDIKQLFDTDKKASMALGIDEDVVAELEGNYNFEIVSIERQEEAQLNETLFEKIFPNEEIKDVEEFRAKIKEVYTAQLKPYQRNYVAMQLTELLLDKHSIDLPQDFMRRWLKEVSKEIDTDEQANESLPQFNRDLKWTIIKNKVAKEHGVQIEPDEIKEAAATRLKQNPYFAQIQLPEEQMQAMIDNYFQMLMSDEKYAEERNNIINELAETKIVDLLLDKVSIKEESIEEDKLFEALQKLDTEIAEKHGIPIRKKEEEETEKDPLEELSQESTNA